MGYAEYLPSPTLRSWVRCFWSILDEPSDEIQEVWPDGCVELVFNLGNVLLVDVDGSSRPFPKVAVLGLQTDILKVKSEGVVRLLGARLLPFGIKDWQPSELESLAAEIDPLLRAENFEKAVKHLEVWLERQPEVDSRIGSALKKIYTGNGNVSVAELARIEGISSRQLQRLFLSSLGVSPKMLARVVRFSRSWSLMLGKPDLSLAGLALELGYTDQAHFNNEFSSFGKQSPSTFRKNRAQKQRMSHSSKT